MHRYKSLCSRIRDAVDRRRRGRESANRLPKIVLTSRFCDIITFIQTKGSRNWNNIAIRISSVLICTRKIHVMLHCSVLKRFCTVHSSLMSIWVTRKIVWWIMQWYQMGLDDAALSAEEVPSVSQWLLELHQFKRTPLSSDPFISHSAAAQQLHACSLSFCWWWRFVRHWRSLQKREKLWASDVCHLTDNDFSLKLKSKKVVKYFSLIQVWQFSISCADYDFNQTESKVKGVVLCWSKTQTTLSLFLAW